MARQKFFRVIVKSPKGKIYGIFSGGYDIDLLGKRRGMSRSEAYNLYKKIPRRGEESSLQLNRDLIISCCFG